MRIFLAGATGVIGRSLVPALIRAGHDVVGTTRSASKAGPLAAAGAEAVVVDALDPEAVRAAVVKARPEVMIHQLTSIGAANFKDVDAAFAATNELRTSGLDHLLAGARAAGARRFIAQSFTGWPNQRSGGMVKTEEDPLDTRPATRSQNTLAAIRYVEQTVPVANGLDGVVLRYGFFYGPGTAIGMGGEIVNLVARRRMPIVGGGAGVFSFVHIDDAAAAAVAALRRGARGTYNIVDDDPAPVAVWLPYLAATIGAKPPRRMPAWLARPIVGEFGVNMMTAMRGSSNAKARRELGWTPIYSSWRDGFRRGFG